MPNGSVPSSPQQTGTKVDFRSIINTMMQVVLRPIEFFKKMPKDGGYSDPVIFLVSMGILTSIIQIMCKLLGVCGFSESFSIVVFAFIITPLLMLGFGFVIAIIWFVIWKLMGSEEVYEVAFRCIAYTSGVSVFTTAMYAIPYVGGILGLAWIMYLMIIISTEVHRLELHHTLKVLTIIFLFLALTATCSQYQTRKMAKQTNDYHEKFGEKMDMTPKEAGRDVGELLKGMKNTIEPDK